MRKKILYVITKSVWGGAQKYVYDLATNLPKDRFEAVIVTGGRGPLVDRLNSAAIRTITLPTLQEQGAMLEVIFSFINIRALFALVKIFRQEKPDIIHLNSSKIGGLGAVAAWLTPKVNGQKSKVVFTLHGWPFKESRPWWQRAIIFILSWFSIIFTNKVVLINTADYRTALKFIPRSKCELIFNGIGDIAFLPRDEARSFLAKKIGCPITSQTVLIGTVAELTKNKNLSVLICALSMLNLNGNHTGLTSIIIGEGNERNRLENLITTSIQGSVKIFLVGSATNAERYLKGFDIYALPSSKEGLPYTIMEAMAAGIPAIATHVGGIPDLIDHDINGIIIPPQNQEALSSSIKRLAKNRALREVLGTNASKKIRENFSLNAMIKNTITVYEKI